jgi:hypothetical protein
MVSRRGCCGLLEFEPGLGRGMLELPELRLGLEISLRFTALLSGEGVNA